jgi:hypothetical protein
MDTPQTDRTNTEIGGPREAGEMFGAMRNEHSQRLPMPKFARLVHMILNTYIAAVVLLVILRGIDNALHG